MAKPVSGKLTDRDVELMKRLVPTAKLLRAKYDEAALPGSTVDLTASVKALYQEILDGYLRIYKKKGTNDLQDGTPPDIVVAVGYIRTAVLVPSRKSFPKLWSDPGSGRLLFNKETVEILLGALALWDRKNDNTVKHTAKCILFLHGMFEPDASAKETRIVELAREKLTQWGQLPDPASAVPPPPPPPASHIPKPLNAHTVVPDLGEELLPEPLKAALRTAAPGAVAAGGDRAARSVNVIDVVRMDGFACYPQAEIARQFPDPGDGEYRDYLERRLAEIERFLDAEHLLDDPAPVPLVPAPVPLVPAPVPPPPAPASAGRVRLTPDPATDDLLPDAIKVEARRLAPGCVNDAGTRIEQRFVLLAQRLRDAGHPVYASNEIDANFPGSRYESVRGFLRDRFTALIEFVGDEALFPPVTPAAPRVRKPRGFVMRWFIRFLWLLLGLLVLALAALLTVKLPYPVVGEWQSQFRAVGGWEQPLDAPGEWSWVKSIREWEAPVWLKGRSPQDDVATTIDQKGAVGVTLRIRHYCDRLEQAQTKFEAAKAYLGSEEGQRRLAELQKSGSGDAQERWRKLSEIPFGYTPDEVVKQRDRAAQFKEKLEAGTATYREMNELYDLTLWSVEKLRVPVEDRTGLTPATGTDNPEAWADALDRLRKQAEAVTVK